MAHERGASHNPRVSREELGREITRRLLAATAHESGGSDSFVEIARREWAILPPSERDLLSAIAHEAYPDPDDINAREALTRYALVSDHVRAQVEQAVMLEAMFTAVDTPADGEQSAA